MVESGGHESGWVWNSWYHTPPVLWVLSELLRQGPTHTRAPAWAVCTSPQARDRGLRKGGLSARCPSSSLLILDATVSEMEEKLGQGGSEYTVLRRFLTLETRDLCSKLHVVRY